MSILDPVGILDSENLGFLKEMVGETQDADNNRRRFDVGTIKRRNNLRIMEAWFVVRVLKWRFRLDNIRSDSQGDARITLYYGNRYDTGIDSYEGPMPVYLDYNDRPYVALPMGNVYLTEGPVSEIPKRMSWVFISAVFFGLIFASALHMQMPEYNYNWVVWLMLLCGLV